ncbi:hypothetical protein OKA05_02035 [Luteolibacter arcticus]|uniref:Uncharacterized protein n=1 Tax=Luteolibacter arcticus TaxID=1581411 RepID=A0ABT3GCF1_9BACT|nr:hypothetical protein [Luteolibacter arcticus]MCW1921312.1 hypothetical protein [Luteolibacter arcticus]
MGQIQDQLAAAFLEMRDAVGVSITFDATTIQAVVSETPFGRELVAGGFQTEADSEGMLLLSDLPSQPTLGRLVRYKDMPWTVSKVDVQPGHLVGKFTLKPVKR